MQYKDILLYIDDGDSNAARVEAVLGLAKKQGATVTGVTLSVLKPPHVIVSATNVLKDMCKKAAQQRVENFIESAEAAGVSARSQIIHGNEKTSVRKLSQLARNFDLVVLRQANPSRENTALVEEIAEQVILLGGRPVFFMPYIGAHRIPLKKAIIAWDGTPAATRAVHDALPVLAGLDQVTILIVEGKTKTAKGELLADNLVQHLANHGISAEVKRRNTGGAEVPTILLNEIADNDIDLLVMGGYGTPSLQQKIFGGVTRTILASMIVPVFMSH